MKTLATVFLSIFFVTINSLENIGEKSKRINSATISAGVYSSVQLGFGEINYQINRESYLILKGGVLVGLMPGVGILYQINNFRNKERTGFYTNVDVGADVFQPILPGDPRQRFRLENISHAIA